MALSGVRSSWLMVARKRDLAILACSACRRGLVGDLSRFQLGDQRVLFGSELEHGDDRRVEPVHQPDEIDVHADRHGRHRPVERVVEERKADDDGDLAIGSVPA